MTASRPGGRPSAPSFVAQLREEPYVGVSGLLQFMSDYAALRDTETNFMWYQTVTTNEFLVDKFGGFGHSGDSASNLTDDEVAQIAAALPYIKENAATGVEGNIAEIAARQTSGDYFERMVNGKASPTTLLSVRPIGSTARGTAVHPLDDVDIMAVFEATLSPLWKMVRRHSNTWLRYVAEALHSFQTPVEIYNGESIRWVTKPAVDIVPVFRFEGAYLLPGMGAWMKTDPLVHASWLDKLDSQNGGRVRPMIRLLKHWNGVRGRPLKSFHLEVVAASFFATQATTVSEGLLTFFQACHDQGHSFWSVSDPAGYTDDLSSYVGVTNPVRTGECENTLTLIERANVAEARSDPVEAMKAWAEVFRFPLQWAD